MDQRARQHAQLLDAARLTLEHHGAAAELATVLYDRWYAPADGAHELTLGPQEVTAHLRAADAASGRFEPGWVVLAPEDAVVRVGPPTSPWQVAAANGDETRWVDPIDLLFADGPGLRPPAGAAVAVTARRDSISVLPGWWTTMSRSWPHASPTLIRLYWSVEPKHLFQVVRTITGALDAERPYALKCPLDMNRCCRPDAVVLFLQAADWATMSARVVDAHLRAQPWMRRRVPALTLELASGLGLAEDPAGDSFGTSRCAILASSLWKARQAGTRDPDGLRAAAVDGLGEHGVSAETPWLNPGSSADYPWSAGVVSL